MFLTMQEQEALVAKKLATKKTCGNFVTYKYHKRVMYDYLWDKHPELLECRGHTYDIRTGELVLAAPRKSFNYLERDTWKDVPLNTEVIAFRKWNGFMASARIVDGELLVATTGTTNPETSQYVGWARREILALPQDEAPTENATSIYEIVIPEDPHIVADEINGAIPLIARMNNDVSYNFPVGSYDFISDYMITNSLGGILELAKKERHEGWMVYDAKEFVGCVPIPSTCKIKTDYYVGKKKLMRMSPAKAAPLFTASGNCFAPIISTLPERWHCLAYNLQRHTTKEIWVNSTDQERRAIIEELEERYYA